MKLEVVDYNSLIIDSCGTVLDAYNAMDPLIHPHEFGRSQRAVVDRNLIRMIIASDRILDLVLPVPTAGEIHGLPREATTASDDFEIVIVDRENPSWDFKPWFAEKASNLKGAVTKVAVELEQELSRVPKDEASETEIEKFKRSVIRPHFDEIQARAHTILDMMQSGKLIVKGSRLHEYDDEEDT